MSSREDSPLLESENEISADHIKPLSYTSSFWLLLQSEPSYFLSILINFSTSVQYYVLVTLIPLYFSDKYEFSDPAAGAMFGIFGVVIGLSSVYLSYMIQVINYKRGLYVSFVLGIFGFALMLVEGVWINVLAILGFQAVSCSITWPYIEYGIKKYSQKEIRSLSTSVFYMSQYFAGIVAGVTIDTLWSVIPNKDLLYTLITTICIILLSLASISLYFSRPISSLNPDSTPSNTIHKTKRFWRYLLLILLLILLRSCSFGHLDATLPKYMLRTQGEDAHFGIMLAIHSLNMILGLLILTSLTYYFNIYNLIAAGAAIGSLGSIFLIFSNEFSGFTLFVMLISTGESIWVPRLLDYTYAVAPEGQEGIFLALCNCPFYFGMIFTGGASGWLLFEFCPSEGGIEECYLVWVYVFYFSVFITAMLVVLKNVIVGPNGESDEVVCCFRDKAVDEGD